MSTPIAAPDLTQRPPRSPRCRLGGYALMPRMLDKARATITGKNGEYHFNCPLDKRLLSYLDLDPEALLTEVSTGSGDGEILNWIKANAKSKHEPWEIEQWSAYQEKRSPESDEETLVYFTEMVGKLSKTREDLVAWMDVLDADDFTTFGGKL
jgi:uncharacterized protein DUF5069